MDAEHTLATMLEKGIEKRVCRRPKGKLARNKAGKGGSDGEGRGGKRDERGGRKSRKEERDGDGKLGVYNKKVVSGRLQRECHELENIISASRLALLVITSQHRFAQASNTEDRASRTSATSGVRGYKSRTKSMMICAEAGPRRHCQWAR